MKQNFKLYSKYLILLLFGAALINAFFHPTPAEMRTRVFSLSEWQMFGVSMIAAAIITPIVELLKAHRQRKSGTPQA